MVREGGWLAGLGGGVAPGGGGGGGYLFASKHEAGVKFSRILRFKGGKNLILINYVIE